MPRFDFKWLYSIKAVIEKRYPDEKTLIYSEYGGFTIGTEELLIVQLFYTLYIKKYGIKFVVQKANGIKNEYAKTWADFALSRVPAVIRYLNEEFDEQIEDILSRLKIRKETANEITELFNKYKPFVSYNDYYKFAFDNLDSPLYRYFYILLIVLYDFDYPTNSERQWPQNYTQCKAKETCSEKQKCKSNPICRHFENLFGRDYNFTEEMNEFQKELTQKFIEAAPLDKKELALSRLYESLQQINQSGLYQDKLSLSYNKVLYSEGAPLTGTFFISWNKVQFFDGFYIVKHPNMPFNKANPYRIEDKNSRKVFNDINSLFMKKLPPLYVESINGKIIEVHNQANLASCITTMEHRVSVPNVSRKEPIVKKKVEKRELSSQEAQKACAEFKSRFLDFLCSRQLDKYKVICVIEHKVNSSGAVSSEYSFIFTIAETARKTYLAYESSEESRCTYILPISRNFWMQSVEKIYNFFASNEINKRQLMASKLVDLNLAGDYDYQRILHSDYFSWVDKIKYCQYR